MIDVSVWRPRMAAHPERAVLWLMSETAVRIVERLCPACPLPFFGLTLRKS